MLTWKRTYYHSPCSFSSLQSQFVAPDAPRRWSDQMLVLLFSAFSLCYLSCRANKTPFSCFCTLSPSPPPTFSAPAPKFARQDHRSHNFSLSSSSFVQNDFIKIERTTTRTLFHKEHLPQYRKLDNKSDRPTRYRLISLVLLPQMYKWAHYRILSVREYLEGYGSSKGRSREEPDSQDGNVVVDLRSVSLADALGDADDVALLKETTVRKW